jgi:hypothetical protein
MTSTTQALILNAIVVAQFVRWSSAISKRTEAIFDIHASFSTLVRLISFQPDLSL